MKKATATKGLPIMEIADGSTVGHVDKIIVDLRAKKVVYFTVHDNTVVPLSDCVGIGNDCVVIRSVGSVNKVFDEREIAEAMNQGLDLFGMQVMSSAGNIIGRVVDFEYIRRSGELVTVYFDDGSAADNANILSISKGVMFVEDVAGNLIDELDYEDDEDEDDDDDPYAYLIDKAVNEAVVSDDGLFAIAAGTVLTEELLEEAAAHDALLKIALQVD